MSDKMQRPNRGRAHRGRALLLLTVLLAAAGAGHTGEGDSVPDACRIEPGSIPGDAATMACYEALDTNGDAALSEQEAAVLPRLQGRFDVLDRDGSGQLSPDEFQAGQSTPAQRGGGKGV
jgi:hypothetical protein